MKKKSHRIGSNSDDKKLSCAALTGRFEIAATWKIPSFRRRQSMHRGGRPSFPARTGAFAAPSSIGGNIPSETTSTTTASFRTSKTVPGLRSVASARPRQTPPSPRGRWFSVSRMLPALLSLSLSLSLSGCLFQDCGLVSKEKDPFASSLSRPIRENQRRKWSDVCVLVEVSTNPEQCVSLSLLSIE